MTQSTHPYVLQVHRAAPIVFCGKGMLIETKPDDPPESRQIEERTAIHSFVDEGWDGTTRNTEYIEQKSVENH